MRRISQVLPGLMEYRLCRSCQTITRPIAEALAELLDDIASEEAEWGDDQFDEYRVE